MIDGYEKISLRDFQEYVNNFAYERNLDSVYIQISSTAGNLNFRLESYLKVNEVQVNGPIEKETGLYLANVEGTIVSNDLRIDDILSFSRAINDNGLFLIDTMSGFYYLRVTEFTKILTDTRYNH